MTTALSLIALTFAGLYAFEFWRRAKLHAANQRQEEENKEKLAALNQRLEEEIRRLQSEGERFKSHYEGEALKIHSAAETQITRLAAELERLKRHEGAANSEAEARE